MKNNNDSNYFFIERLDKEKKADSLSNIYNLKVLEKETKTKNDNKNEKYCQSLIKGEDADKLRYGENFIIIQAIKKAILSSNFSYKWGLIDYRYNLILFQIIHLIYPIVIIIIYLYKRINTLNLIINKNESFDVSKTTFNFTDSINDYANEFINNLYHSDETNSDEDIDIYSRYNYIIGPFFNNFLMIVIWIIFLFKFIPQRNKINEIIYKFTKYLLVCESYGNKNYYYHLLDDYSILVTKKDYFISNKDTSEINEKLSPEKNIFSYCINYINDYHLKGNNKSIYYELVSNFDKDSIMLLREFIKENIEEKNKKMIKRILVPTTIFLCSTFFYNRTIFKYINIYLSGMSLIKILLEYFCNEYFNSNDKKLDLFIDRYNDTLIQKKKFIYRRNKLIMFLTLKDSNYDKKQVIRAIEKIIDS